MNSSRGTFIVAGSSLLMACSGRTQTRFIPGKLRPSFTEAMPGDPPLCTSSSQVNCIDPQSGLYVIGSVSARIAPSSVQSSWFASGQNSYSGPLYRFATALEKCLSDNAAQLTAYAFSMARYLQSNWSTFTSATSDLKTYVGVYLAGGATAFELIGAVLATLSVSEWAVLLLALGVTAFEIASQVRCYALANAAIQ